jgi:hypothetical protein
MRAGRHGRTRWPEVVNARLERALAVRVVRVRAQEPAPVRGPGDPKVDRLVREPVFLCSSVRSGSTLLRAILDSHSQVHAPHETHVRRLQVVPTTSPVRQAMSALDLNVRDLEHLLWDRVLHRELARSGKQIIVEKTPSNVFAVKRLMTAWPDARLVFLLRHPYSVACSWHEADPARRPMSYAIPYTLNFMQHVERARQRYDGLTVRYEDLTTDPGGQTQRLCEFLGVPWEEGMIEYGKHHAPDRFVSGIGDWSEKIRSGTVQRGRPLPAPEDVPEALREMCRTWGY